MALCIPYRQSCHVSWVHEVTHWVAHLDRETMIELPVSRIAERHKLELRDRLKALPWSLMSDDELEVSYRPESRPRIY